MVAPAHAVDETDAWNEDGAGGAETINVPEITPTAAASVHAWELDEDDTTVVDRRPWRDVWRHAAVMVLSGVLLAALALAVSVLARDKRSDNAVKPFPSIVTTTMPSPPSVAAPMTPIAVPPSSTTPVPALPPEDERFLAMLKRDGLPDPVAVGPVIAAAADVCRMVSHGDEYSYVESFMVPPHGVFTQRQAEVFLADALAVYCPHAAIPTSAAVVPPSAAEQDQRYLAALNAGGIAITDVGVVTRGAREVCADLGAGKSKAAIEADVMKSNHTLTVGNAATLVNSAISFYCPQYGENE